MATKPTIFEQTPPEQHLQKETKPTIFEQLQVEP